MNNKAIKMAPKFHGVRIKVDARDVASGGTDGYYELYIDSILKGYVRKESKE